MTTDPRFARSADALAAAVLELAAERPIEEVSVTEISRLAGVTRATFYNHATSPEMLLGRVLSRELDEVRDRFLEAVAGVQGSVEAEWRESARLLLDHIDSRAAVYRTGLARSEDGRGSMLAQLLAHHIERSLEIYRDGLEPANPTDTGGDVRARIAGAFLSHGIVGAYRTWLLHSAPRDRELVLEVILDSTPREWFVVGGG